MMHLMTATSARTPSATETEYNMTLLPNGLRLITAPMPHTRSVAVSIYVGAGSRYETPAEAGISHFVEHLCFKGTAKRPTAQDISEAIDGVGGVLNAATDREYTVYYAKVARAAPRAWPWTCSPTWCSRPSSTPIELEKERKVVLEELAIGRRLARPAGRPPARRAAVARPAPRLGRRRHRGVGRRPHARHGARLRQAPVRARPTWSSRSPATSTRTRSARLVGETLGAMPAGKPKAWFPADDDPERAAASSC